MPPYAFNFTHPKRRLPASLTFIIFFLVCLRILSEVVEKKMELFPSCSLSVMLTQTTSSTTESSRANDAVVMKGSRGGWLRSMWSKTSEGWGCSLENSETGTYASTPCAGGNHGLTCTCTSVFPSGWLLSAIASRLTLFWSVSAFPLMVSFPPQAPDPKLHIQDPHSPAVLWQQVQSLPKVGTRLVAPSRWCTSWLLSPGNSARRDEAEPSVIL